MKQSAKKTWGWIAGGGLFLATKLNWLIALLKIGKVATLVSMFVSIAVYAAVYEWKFAVILVYHMFVHEMGHLVAAKRKGVPTSPAVFIPFLGAVIGMKEKPKNAIDEAYIAYGGPLFGLLAILPAIPLYLYTNDPIWGLAITIGALINFFNMLPVSPLDGGRILAMFSSKVWLFGLVLVLGIAFISPSPILFLIFLFGISSWFDRVTDRKRIIRLNQKKKRYDEWLETVNQEEIVSYSQIKEKSREMMELSRQVSQEEDPEKIKELEDAIKERRQIVDEWSEKADQVVQICLQLQKEADELTQKLKSKKRKGRDKWEMRGELSFLNEKINAYYTVALIENVNEPLRNLLVKEVQQNAAAVEKELQSLKGYYQTNGRTKWVCLSLYLALAVTLGMLTYWGSEIMAVHQESIR